MTGIFFMNDLSSHSKESSPGGYPSEAVSQAVLRDRTQVLIRPIRPDDALRLQAGFRRLSPRSIYLRFLEAYKELSDKQAREFSNLDYLNRMALVAEIGEGGEARLIGVARYAMIPMMEPGLAEAAIVVADEYQGRGLGTLLMIKLVQYAHAHGVRAFLATVHNSNTPILRFIKRSGFATQRKMVEPGVWEVRISLDSPLEVPSEAQ